MSHTRTIACWHVLPVVWCNGIIHAVPGGTPVRERVWSMPIVTIVVVVVALMTTIGIVIRSSNIVIWMAIQPIFLIVKRSTLSTWRTCKRVMETVRILVGVMIKTHIFGILVINFLVNEIVLIQIYLMLLDLGNF